MWEQVVDMLRAAALRTAEKVAGFLPGLLGMLVILLGALVLATVARMVVTRVLRGLQFDRRAELLGLATVADWSAMGGPSVLLGRVVMWTILLAGLLAGFSALDAALPEAFARTVFAYVPNLVAAFVILVLGTILARFLARSVLISAVNLQVRSARLFSAGVKWLVLVVAWAMALEHLGIGRGILMLAFGIVFGGVVLALALAVGLGSKDAVSRSLERQLLDADRPDKLTHV
jgi:hypothetical protein